MAECKDQSNKAEALYSLLQLHLRSIQTVVLGCTFSTVRDLCGITAQPTAKAVEFISCIVFTAKELVEIKCDWRVDFLEIWTVNVEVWCCQRHIRIVEHGVQRRRYDCQGGKKVCRWLYVYWMKGAWIWRRTDDVAIAVLDHSNARDRTEGAFTEPFEGEQILRAKITQNTRTRTEISVCSVIYEWNKNPRFRTRSKWITAFAEDDPVRMIWSPPMAMIALERTIPQTSQP